MNLKFQYKFYDQLNDFWLKVTKFPRTLTFVVVVIDEWILKLLLKNGMTNELPVLVGCRTSGKFPRRGHHEPEWAPGHSSTLWILRSGKFLSGRWRFSCSYIFLIRIWKTINVWMNYYSRKCRGIIYFLTFFCK